MYIQVAMMISWVAPVNPSHPYLENGPAPPSAPHHLRISPWLSFRMEHLGDGVLEVDETGLLEKRNKSVGVQRRYSGKAGD